MRVIFASYGRAERLEAVSSIPTDGLAEQYRFLKVDTELREKNYPRRPA
jgi:hypothetical protein